MILLTAVLLVAVPLADVSKEITMSATAFALRGRTSSGIKAQSGVVAADPRILRSVRSSE
jgi:hypothetical protein